LNDGVAELQIGQRTVLADERQQKIHPQITTLMQKAVTSDWRMIRRKRSIREMEKEFEFLPLSAWNS
jgi:hypothetical protein